MTRAEHKQNIINSLTKAQKLAFSPLTFQAVSAMLDLGILKSIDEQPQNRKEIQEALHLSEYTVSTLLEVAQAAEIVVLENNKYSITPLGQAFLYDEMTIVNFNFVKDVCFKGAEKLKDSFLNSEPKGLKELYPDAETIYPYLLTLPEKMKKSWLDFDHYYSDNCFEIIYKIITPVDKIFDIGANTGKFEKVCLKHNQNQDLTLIDLAENIEIVSQNPELAGCKFHAANILSKENNLPQMSGAVLMSQFLDCFSKEQIKFILKKVANSCSQNTKIYILEPFTDRQKFDGAKFSLVHTSLYFTCMANGYSKMYTYQEMEQLVKDSGLKINAIYDALGINDYTLLECVKNG